MAVSARLRRWNSTDKWLDLERFGWMRLRDQVYQDISSGTSFLCSVAFSLPMAPVHPSFQCPSLTTREFKKPRKLTGVLPGIGPISRIWILLLLFPMRKAPWLQPWSSRCSSLYHGVPNWWRVSNHVTFICCVQLHFIQVTSQSQTTFFFFLFVTLLPYVLWLLSWSWANCDCTFVLFSYRPSYA